MRRSTRQSKRSSPSAKNSVDEPKKKIAAVNSKSKISDGSSSESDIENYLKPAAELDLDSVFFTATKSEENSFENIEKDIFSGINRLSDSDSDDTGEKEQSEAEDYVSASNTKPVSKHTVVNFEHIHAYNKKIEEAKKHIDIYKTRKSTEENTDDVSDILAIGELKVPDEFRYSSASGHSSDFETLSDSEKEDWEEVHNVEEAELVPKKGVEITVEIPGNTRKKKGVNLLDVLKRKMNRIKKENQVYIHKVHLLCWIAHGNYVNKVLSDENLLALALSLLPSRQCFPSERLDISYLEDILKWYRKAIEITANAKDVDGKLEDLLEKQIIKREAYNYKMFVYIFICILRSLGVRCRLMLSLQVEPLRPSTTELCSLSKVEPKNVPSKSATTSRDVENTPSVKKIIPKVVSTKKVSKIATKNAKWKNSAIIKKVHFENMCLIDSVEDKKKDIKGDQLLKSSKDKEDKKEEGLVSKGNKRETKKSKEIVDNKEHTTIDSKVKNTKDICNKNNDMLKNRQQHLEIKSKSLNVEDTHLRRSARQKQPTLQEVNKSAESEALKIRQKSQSSRRSETNFTEPLKQKSEKQIDVSNKLSSKISLNLRNKEDTSSVSLIPKTTGKSHKSSHNNKKENKSKPDTKTNGRKQSPISLVPTQELANTNLTNDEKCVSNNRNRRSVSPKESENSKGKKNRNLFKVKIPLKLKPEKSGDTKIEVPKIVVSEDAVEIKKEVIPQLDGANDDDSNISKVKTKPNLGKLQNDLSSQCVKKHPKRLKKLVQYKEVDSDEDFKSPLPKNKTDFPIKKPDFNTASTSQTNLRNLKTKRERLSSQTSSDSDRSKYFGSPPLWKSGIVNDIISLVKQGISEEKQLLRSKLVKHKRMSKSYNSDSDYEPNPIKKKSEEDDVFKEKSTKVKRRIPMKKDILEMEKRKQMQKEEEKKKKGINVWIEVFAEAEEKWIAVDVTKGQVHCVKEICTRATHPIVYILSWDNQNYIKDLSKRYCLNWNTVTRKLRVDDKWWNNTLQPYRSPKNPREREEDEELARQQLEQPLPTTISEYKNHPLYVLRRHLLKFEAIYPPDALTLGFVRNEAVYSRDCVHTLHSRDIWLKHAKVVKLGEEPYKIVKARPKYDKLSNSIITDQPLEIFGKWQIEDYIPPTAENGVVPRNAYGNVELFKACMLPKGTVHLQLSGLNKTARKLNIDCAPAVVGFDFHGGWSHPTFDGFVVCEEFSQQLVGAWVEEQEESEKRAQEKIEKKVYDNWRRLIKGLLIRERLKARYDFGGPAPTTSKGTNSKKKGLSIKKRKIQSDSESE